MASRSRRRKFSVSFATRLWVETEVLAESYEDAVVQAREMKCEELVTTVSGVTVNDSYVDLIGVTDMVALDKVGA